MNRYQLRNTALSQQRPHRLEFSTVRKGLADLDRRVRFGFGPFRDQLPDVERYYRLPFHNTAFFKPLGCMFPDDILFFGYKLSDGIEELSHRQRSRTLLDKNDTDSAGENSTGDCGQENSACGSADRRS